MLVRLQIARQPLLQKSDSLDDLMMTLYWMRSLAARGTRHFDCKQTKLTMRAYIIEMTRLFITLLHTGALFCQLSAVTAFAGTPIITKAKTDIFSPQKPKPKPKAASTRLNPHCSSLLKPQPATEAPVTIEKIMQAFEAADHLRFQYESSYEKEEKDRLTFQEAAEQAVNQLQVYLQTRGVQTQKSALAASLSEDIKFSWPTLEVLPYEDKVSSNDPSAQLGEKPHRLNLYARGLLNRFQTKLIFDFIWLKRISTETGEAKGAFLPLDRHLILSLEALQNERPTLTEMHETLHARFQNERETSPDANLELPLHLFFISDTPIRGEVVGSGYEYQMHFEELWTHAYELKVTMAEDAPDDSLKSAEATEPATTRSQVQTLYAIAETISLAAEKAKLAYLENGVVYEQTLKTRYAYFQSNDAFLLGVALPPKDDNSQTQNEIENAIDDINSAQSIARFVMDYWAQRDQLSDQELNKKAQNFHSELVDFIEKLKNGRQRADSNYDVLAAVMVRNRSAVV